MTCGELLLQRRLSHGDGHRWRTVLRIGPAQLKRAVAWADQAADLDPLVRWRVVRGDLRGESPDGGVTL